MKKLLRPIILSVVSFYLVAQFLPGIDYGGKIENLVLLAFVFSLVSLFIKPIMKIILLPINILTLGTAGFFINIGILWLLEYLLPFFSISGFYFAGATFGGVALPATEVSPLMALALFSFLTSLTSSFLYYLLT